MTSATHGRWFSVVQYAGLAHSRLYRRSYSMLGPVSAWVGDCLSMGKPPRRRMRHPGLLSLSLLSMVRLE